MSGAALQSEVDLSAVNGATGRDGGVEHGERLVAFAEAVMGGDPDAMRRERAALRRVLTDAQFVDACATIGAFNVVDRMADATGIPLDPMIATLSHEVRSELDLARFGSAANTPGARGGA